MKVPHTYITTNTYNKVIYTGVTSDIVKRVKQHKEKYYKGFSSRYNCDKLVFYREFPTMLEAIAFEKKLKAGNRKNKEKLINEMNPEWKDLSEGWYE
ncbi:putative endonuclease containing a URI domain [Aequorivita sublithincola DSM 14238]|uniref:Putative endonuclease containing a URI domain n=1 Tax=Aequorivita sublithincola (strain DSM 14238 / LMG 21431 / ACAM 643 / 9-3) TaxID=746697 RepID=I3YXG3_AEQSU|nr:GIY-YIG nuclease family protein [Aequorivita sublithincola]AFL81681.1 putative endonuclease containing a URI domain [Aequorivita sublithincola DSM 14238]